MEAETKEQLARELREMAREAEELARAAEEDMLEKSRALQDRLAGIVESARSTCKEIEAQAVAGAKATDRVIREYPYYAMGVAVGLGLLVGMLVKRK